jgi:hypothetical protein
MSDLCRNDRAPTAERQAASADRSVMPNEPSDKAFAADVTAALSRLPRVEAVMLGGSRAYGACTSETDWDFALYYRDHFNVEHLPALGWPGEVHPLGSWGGGVFNGGAWLEIEGRKVDIHYRDLADVEKRIADAEQGRFQIDYRRSRGQPHQLV